MVCGRQVLIEVKKKIALYIYFFLELDVIHSIIRSMIIFNVPIARINDITSSVSGSLFSNTEIIYMCVRLCFFLWDPTFSECIPFIISNSFFSESNSVFERYSFPSIFHEVTNVLMIISIRCF